MKHKPVRCRRIPSRFHLPFLLLTVALSTSCGEQPEPEPVIRPVRYVQVFSTGGQRVRTFSGVAQAGIESKLSFKVAGTIQRLAVKVGDRVSTGQLIAELDKEDFRLQVEEAEATVAQARARARNALSDYDRVRGLYENRNASKQDLDAARAASESADAGAESAEKRLELTRRQVAYATLTAPAEGSIAECLVEVNENVSAGQTIVLLTSEGSIEVEVAMPGMLITGIRRGDSVTVTFDALPGKTIPGRVTEVGVAATGMATTFPVTVRLDEDDPGVRPGMAAEVGFRFGSAGARERIYVPPVAVGEDRDGRFVFVVEPAEPGFGVAHRKTVTIGEFGPDGIEILEGLSDGDRVVTAGVTRITDGQKVRLP